MDYAVHLTGWVPTASMRYQGWKITSQQEHLRPDHNTLQIDISKLAAAPYIIRTGGKDYYHHELITIMR